MILVDTNVLLDVVTEDPRWATWSQQQLETTALLDQLAINSVVYAEFSIGYRTVEETDAVLRTIGVGLAEIPRAALFLAGKVFQTYRQRRGAKTGVLPDFFVGAHAAVARVSLLTRDTRRYRAYFPTVELIAPDV